MARRTKWVVAIDWEDRGVIDTDEVVVYEATESEAICKASQKWRMTIGAEWPHCKLLKAWILKPSSRSPVIFNFLDFC